MNMDLLIDTLVSDAQLSTGTPVAWLQARGMVARPVSNHTRVRALPWTPAEEQFYRDNLETMTLEEIAASLGRTAEAVKIHRFRAGLPSHRRTPGFLTTHQIALILGVDGHAPPVWVDCGILPGERTPYEGEIMRRVSWLQFKLWLVRPTSWLYFDVSRIQNPSLRHLVELAQERWGDEWWSTRQAADYLGCDTKDIQRQIKLGKVNAVQAKNTSGRHLDPRWSFWYLRKSDAVRLVIYRGKGAGRHHTPFTPRAEAFMVRAAKSGMRYEVIAKLMKRGNPKAIGYRLKQLGVTRSPQWMFLEAS
jgi:hypothetical protein